VHPNDILTLNVFSFKFYTQTHCTLYCVFVRRCVLICLAHTADQSAESYI